MSLYLSIYLHCSFLCTHPTRDLNHNLSSLALTDCKTELDCLMPKVSSSCEHKTPSAHYSVKHWQKDTHTQTHTNSDVWFHLQSRTLVVSPLWLITGGLETWEALSLCGKMPFSDKHTMLDTFRNSCKCWHTFNFVHLDSWSTDLFSYFPFFLVNRTGMIKIKVAGLFILPHEADISGFCNILYGHANQTGQRWTTVKNIGNNKVAYTKPRKAVRKKSPCTVWIQYNTVCSKFSL